MSSDWIQHVKQTQKDNGCSYKEAMVLAKKTYAGRPRTPRIKRGKGFDGGKLNVGKVFKTISRLNNQPKIREKLKADKRKLEAQLQQQEALNKERGEKLAKYESSYKQQQEAQLGAVTSQQAMKKQLLDLQRENDALKNKPVVPQEEIPKMPIDNLADNTEGFLAKAKRAVGWGSGVGANPWLAHVKAYQAKHGCSYKEALKGAKATYKRQQGKGVCCSKITPEQEDIAVEYGKRRKGIETRVKKFVKRVSEGKVDSQEWNKTWDSFTHEEKEEYRKLTKN